MGFDEMDERTVGLDEELLSTLDELVSDAAGTERPGSDDAHPAGGQTMRRGGLRSVLSGTVTAIRGKGRPGPDR